MVFLDISILIPQEYERMFWVSQALVNHIHTVSTETKRHKTESQMQPDKT